MASPRKVLLITADQWRGDALGLIKSNARLTPNLDRLAAEGVTFRRHFANAAPCGPARACLLTGLYPFLHRSVRNGTPLDHRFTNIALEARKAGYHPVLFGYTDTALDPRAGPSGDPRYETYEGVMPGFELVAVHNESSLHPWLAELVRKGYPIKRPDMSVYRHPGSTERMQRFSRGPALYRAEDSDTAYITDKVLDYLHFRRKEPWFIHAVYLRPHPPLIAPEPYNSLVDAAAVAAPRRLATIEDERRVHPFLDAWLKEQDGVSYFKSQVNMQQLSQEEIREARAVYLGLIAEVDAQVGRILARLRETGEIDETLVILSSDHGEMLGDHWCWGKGGWFDPSYHLPLVIRDPLAPAVARGAERQELTEAVDVAPTILEWLGHSPPETFCGRSLVPWLRGETPESWRKHVVFEFDFRSFGNPGIETTLRLQPDQSTLSVIRSGRFKYVHFTTLPPLLFDLEKDPDEQRDVSGDPAYRDVLTAGARRLLSHRMLYAERSLTNTRLGAGGPKTWTGPRGELADDVFVAGG